MKSNSSFHLKNNSHNGFYCQFNDSDWSRALRSFAVFLVGGFGIIGNIFIIVLALKYTVRRNLHHLIINMAVADTLVVLATFCVGVPQILDYKMWADIKMASGETPCKLFSFLVGTSMSVSYTTLVIICIERFRASRQTVQISKPYTLKQRLAIVGCSWLVTAVFVAVEIPYRTVKERLPGAYVCQGSSQTPVSLRVFYYTVFLFATFCIVTISIVTLRRISRRKAIEASLSELQRKTREKRIAKSIKMVLCSLIVYLISYFPFLIWNILKLIHSDPHSFLCYELNIFDFLTNFLPLVNSCFSPGIYLVFLPDFREAAKKVLRRNKHIAGCNSGQQEPSRGEIKNIHSRKTKIDSQNKTTVV